MPIDTNSAPFIIDVVALLVSFVIGVAIPWLTELLAHATAPMWIRSILNFGLSALVGVLTTITISDFHTIGDYLLAIVFAWLATMRAHYAGMANFVALRTGSFGIGASTRTTHLD